MTRSCIGPIPLPLAAVKQAEVAIIGREGGSARHMRNSCRLSLKAQTCR